LQYLSRLVPRLKRANGPRLQERKKEWPRKKKWVRSWFLYFFKVLMSVHHEETVVSFTGAAGREGVRRTASEENSR
jgi:hypothetical protein